MEINTCIKETFSVIGKEGSTNDGDGFIQRLWEGDNSHFNEVSSLAKKDQDGNILGVWSDMTDFSRSFYPWEDNFSKGLYLAGFEVIDNANPPINYLNENNIRLVGAVQEFNCPEDGHV
ncbi:MAG TPA: AraC family transcriptional regulator [Tissierellaceae bacterium]|nr:AraC family transcriptional regulator [Tissierellaceae bacterium]